PVGPIFVAGVQRLFNKQGAKPGAINKKIAWNFFTRGKNQSLYMASLRVERYLFNFALSAHYTALLTVLTQKIGVAASVKMVGVAQSTLWIKHKAAGFGSTNI